MVILPIVKLKPILFFGIHVSQTHQGHANVTSLTLGAGSLSKHCELGLTRNPIHAITLYVA